MARKLASVQKILAIDPIENADKIEVATIVGWKVVVKKGEFQVSDPCVYIEIDSQLPDKSEFDFLRKDKFRIKTRKIRQQVSQGICFSMSILPKNDKYVIDQDVTEILGIINYKDQEEEKDPVPTVPKPKNKILKFLFDHTITRPLAVLICRLTKTKKEAWPKFITKTDEERIQNDPRFFDRNDVSNCYFSEKLDGQSSTFFIKKKGFGYEFGVCSRNLWLKTKHKCNWWDMAIKYDIEAKLRQLGKEMYIQGEIVGPNIQGNKYNLKEKELFLFNVYLLKENRFMGYGEMEWLSNYLGCKIVPRLELPKEDPPTIVQTWIEYSKGNSLINSNVLREGIVIRSNNLNKKESIKIINPDFLLKYDK